MCHTYGGHPLGARPSDLLACLAVCIADAGCQKSVTLALPGAFERVALHSLHHLRHGVAAARRPRTAPRAGWGILPRPQPPPLPPTLPLSSFGVDGCCRRCRLRGGRRHRRQRRLAATAIAAASRHYQPRAQRPRHYHGGGSPRGRAPLSRLLIRQARRVGDALPAPPLPLPTASQHF